MDNRLQRYLATRVQGRRTGIYSVCSAHPLVVRAAAQQAVVDGSWLLVEATSNQVNQDGGYTGMRPAQFKTFVAEIAIEAGLPLDRLILGGDHLGPNPWRHLPADEAMRHAGVMVAEYAAAGFSKIHLDASMKCKGDPDVLSDEIIARRAAQLSAIAEQTHEAMGPDAEPIVYIIGTEVPTPGGATHALEGLQVTSTSAAEKTWNVHREVFAECGLEKLWQRVIALVVQPGVEFAHDSVVSYDREKARELTGWLAGRSEPLTFEAHSTDYQPADSYHRLVTDGFGILKVGPAFTFALREGLFALEEIERELVDVAQCSHLREVVEQVMVQYPQQWKSHYHGNEETQRLLRTYSYSDRMRYYWLMPAIESSVETLLRNLRNVEIPEVLLSRFLPIQYARVREGHLQKEPVALLISKISEVLEVYARACAV